jgi:carboxyl-terminal processing protease
MILQKRLLPALLAFFMLMCTVCQSANACSEQGTRAQEAYNTAWELVRDRYVDTTFNGQDWSVWQHKFDGQLTSMSQAYDAIKTMLASLNDRYTRLLKPMSEQAQSTVDGHIAMSADSADSKNAGVTGNMLAGNVGYIKIGSFTAASRADEVRVCLQHLSQAKALIIDLRGNQGGLVKNALEMADMLLSNGNIVTTVSRDGSKTYTASGNQVSGQQLVVLVDEQTASASEILTGALQANHRALVVGTRTFGKGLVQEVDAISGGAELRTTVAHYLTPDGSDINKVGLQPDVQIENGQDALQVALNRM